jgi:hypothetical protein
MATQSNPVPQFSQEQMQQIIAGLAANLRNDPQLRQQIQGPPGPPGNPGEVLDNRWRIEEFGLFQPDLQVDSSHPAGDVVTIGKDTFYRNVDAFCERVRDAVSLKGPDVVRENLHLCLRGTASRWWTFELSELDKQAIRRDDTPRLSQWTGRLTSRFRPRLAQAMRENSDLVFQISDVRAEQSVLVYFQSKLLRARSCGFESTQAALLQVYMGIDTVLRRDLFEPTSETSVAQFRELLSEKEEIWRELYRPRSSQPQYPRASPYQPSTSRQAQLWRTPVTPQRQVAPSTRGQSQWQTRQATPQQWPRASPQSPLSRLPCPYHATRGETYYHLAKDCRLPKPPSPLPPLPAGDRITQISFGHAARQSSQYDPTTDRESEHFDPHRSDIGSDQYYGDEGDYDAEQIAFLNPLPTDAGEYVEDDAFIHLLQPVVDPQVQHRCKRCDYIGSSRNALFLHLRANNHFASPDPVAEIRGPRAEVDIIRSQAPPVTGTGMSFRSYNYTEIAIRFDPEGEDAWVCLDSGCGMSCVDRDLVPPGATVLGLHEPVKIRGLGDKVHLSTDYFVHEALLPGVTPEGKPALGCIKREFHVVDRLACGALLGTDFIDPEGILIDTQSRTATVRSCNDLVCPIRITPRGSAIQHRSVRSAKNVTVRPHTKQLIPIKVKSLPVGRDYRFTAQYSPDTSYLAISGILPEAIVDSEVTSVAYYNNSNHSVTIGKDVHLGEISDYGQDEKATPEDADVVDALFAYASIIPSLSLALGTGLTALTCTPLSPGTPTRINTTTLPSDTTVSAYTLVPDLQPVQGNDGHTFGSEGVVVNTTDDITPLQIATLKSTLASFPSLWEDRLGRVIEPEEDWLQIPLKPGAVIESKGRYRVSRKDEAVIDQVFDQMRAEDRLTDAPPNVPVGWPVFVVWHKGKGRPVVDLRSLNSKVMVDSYPLPRQDEVANKIKGKRFISLFDMQKSFYQRNVARKDRWKTSVVTHRGQEMFNVALMGYCNSPSHMQRFMDKVLKAYAEFAKCFVDDIAVFSDTFEEHVTHLTKLLSLLEELNITLSPWKCFVGFHKLGVLGLLVDRFGLSTLEQKTEAISKLEFPQTLQQLDYFLGLAGWYRQFVARFAALSKPLQELKTKMFHNSPARKGRSRKAFTQSQTILHPTLLETTAFEVLKAALCAPTVLIHFDHELPLLYYIDSSREGGYACAIHQVPKDSMGRMSVEDVLNGNHDRRLERPVMYISRLLNRHEVNYWPTELEIAGIVWAMQKTHHMIEGTNHVKIFTDHKAAEDILTMKSMKTSSTVHQNLRLIRASQYVSQYPQVVFVYRPGKDHVNADALSRLRSVKPPSDAQSVDDSVFGFVATVLGLSMPVMMEFTEGYKKDRHFSLIYSELVSKLDKQQGTEEEILNSSEGSQVSYASIAKAPGSAPHQARYGGFLARRVNGHTLLYIQDPDKHPRLCVPSSCHRLFFKSAHDDSNHAGFERAYKRLRPNYYLKDLSTSLRSYISSCPSCLRNNPVRHKPFGQLQPVDIPATPFEMITLDLVVKLPDVPFDNNNYDSFMTVTDKLTKMVTIILGREDWNAERWAQAFWHCYYRRWGIPQRVISDRGKIFLSEFWTGLFRLMRTDLLVTTAYHPQSDGQSERTNQTVEIALRHLVGASKLDWPDFLTEVEFVHNTAVNVSTNKSPMEMVTGLTLRSGFESATPRITGPTDWTQHRQLLRDEAHDALVFAQAKMSIYYDKKHTPISFRPGDKVYISLAKGFASGYKLPHNVVNRKLSQQHVGPFEVLSAVGSLAYRLDIPNTWRIHPVISVAHLKRAPDSDPFERELQPIPDVIQDDTGEHEEWEVEEVLDSRALGKKTKRKQYWVKWKGFGPEHNTWVNEDDMNAKDLIDSFESKDAFEAVATTPMPLREGPVWSSNLHTPRPPRSSRVDNDGRLNPRSPSPTPVLRRRSARITYPPSLQG